MNTLRFVVLSAGVLTATTGLLVACGDDDGVLLDVSDSGADVQQSDVNHPTDSGGGSPDVSVPDTGSENDDAGDEDADAGLTFFDAATYDAGPDAGFVPDAGEAAQQLADVYCGTVARCCFGDSTLQQGAPLPDGGTFNRSLCLSDYGANGFEQASQETTVNPKHVIVDQTGSNACAQKLQALSCNLGFDEFNSIRQACYGALLGTQGPGESCTVAAECQKGLFCNDPDGGAGSGTCQLLRTTGQSCGDVTNKANDAQHICSYRYSGNPTRHCGYFDYDAGAFVPQAQWTCQDDLPNGSKCPNSAWCSAGICDFTTHLCQATSQYFPPDACNRYRQ